MSTDPKKQIEKLRQQILEHDYKYYVLNEPSISDQQYDCLFDELKKLEQQNPALITPDSPTQRVSGQPLDRFKTVTHSIPMLSIDNTYNEGELREFDKRVAKNLQTTDYTYIVEPKIDGLAINLRYDDGYLVLGATRGDGKRGDDVTNNIRTIKSIPLHLKGSQFPRTLEVRGEVYMSNNAFKELNHEKNKSGEPEFANPRNAAAGSLKLLDARTTARRKLSFFAYGIGQSREDFADGHFCAMQKLKDFGLPVNENIAKARNIEKVIELCHNFENKRQKLGYLIDGMVIKIDNFQQREKLGFTGRAPRWCIAYKFAAEKAETKIKSIDFQVGKTGIITPVANLEPVKLAGTTVKRASLHNFDEIDRLNVGVGDKVLVEKAGEIIPQVIKVTEKSENGSKLQRPQKCPICNGPVKKDPNGVYLRCENAGCPAVLREKLIYFAGKGQMDIAMLGPALIDQLLEKKLIKNFADLYKLKFHQLAQLERMGDKSAEKVLDSIENSKTQTLSRFINALGINNVGGQSAEILANEFESIENIMNADFDRLSQIDQFGPVMAKSTYDYFHNEKNIELINQMLKCGVNPQHQKTTSLKLQGMKIVVTGTLENLKRDQIKQLIKDNGGNVTSSVSSNTALLIAGNNPGSKLEDAKKHNVKIIDESDFMKLLGE